MVLSTAPLNFRPHFLAGSSSSSAETLRQMSHQGRGYASRAGPSRGGGPSRRGGPGKGGGPPPKFTRSPGQPKRGPPPAAAGKPVAAGKPIAAEKPPEATTKNSPGGSPKKLRYPQPQNAPAKPWTPTFMLKKRKVLTKRMGFLLQVSSLSLCLNSRR
jgi:hypothetical protein